MAGLGPAIHELIVAFGAAPSIVRSPWMPGTSPGMTMEVEVAALKGGEGKGAFNSGVD
jgi:hypothetical protein